MRLRTLRPHLNKRTIIDKIIAALSADLESYNISARAAFAAATDPQSKAENKYDTRSLEASYLARGQSQQMLEIMRTLQLYETLPVREFASGAVIDIGAVIELEREGERTFFFLGPGAGGTEIACGGKEILVITPQSPMGQELLGRKQGEVAQLPAGRAKAAFRVVTVK